MLLPGAAALIARCCRCCRWRVACALQTTSRVCHRKGGWHAMPRATRLRVRAASRFAAAGGVDLHLGMCVAAAWCCSGACVRMQQPTRTCVLSLLLLSTCVPPSLPLDPCLFLSHTHSLTLTFTHSLCPSLALCSAGLVGEEVYLHPRSCLAASAPELLVYCDIVATAKRPYMATVTAIEPQWLADAGSGLCKGARRSCGSCAGWPDADARVVAEPCCFDSRRPASADVAGTSVLAPPAHSLPCSTAAAERSAPAPSTTLPSPLLLLLQSLAR